LKIGIFGGSFDPVHRGHLFLAKTAISKLGLDRIIFIPAYQNPLKHNKPENNLHRYKMLLLATKDNPLFFIDDFELNNPVKSYTINTLHYLHSKYEKDEFFLLIGGDSAESFFKWKDFKILLTLCTLIIFKRKDSFIPESLKDKSIIIDFDCPYSSTDIRKKISSGNIPYNALPERVSEYIEKFGLYYK